MNFKCTTHLVFLQICFSNILECSDVCFSLKRLIFFSVLSFNIVTFPVLYIFYSNVQLVIANYIFANAPRLCKLCAQGLSSNEAREDTNKNSREHLHQGKSVHKDEKTQTNT